MKNNWRNNSVWIVVLLMVMASCSKQSEKNAQVDTYTCPMHPTVISDRAGSCPVCGMDLVRKARAGEEVEITEDLAKLLKSPNELVVASIKTIKASYKSVPLRVEAQGIVTYDTRNIYTIPARVGGRLEKIFLKFAFEPVAKGQKVAEIYSPELITAQRELLYLLESDAGNSELIASAKNKVSLLGASEAQIDALIQRKEVLNTFSVYSPYNGYLVNDGPAPSSAAPAAAPSAPAGGGMDAMGASSVSSPGMAGGAQPAQGSLLREGSYVSTGQTLFKVVNSSSLWVELDLPASQAGAVKKGTPIQLDFGNGRETSAAVDFIQPFFTEGEEFVKLRVYTTKSEGMHIGHLVKAKLDVSANESLWLPREAVLDLGLHQVVFVKEQGVLKPKKIVTGTKAEGWIEVTQGLTTSEEIAANAQYLVDSESFVKVN